MQNVFSQKSKDFIPVSHEYLNFMGRVDFFDKQVAPYDWPGVIVGFRFTGDEIKLHFTGGERNYIDLFIDEKFISTLHAKEYTVADVKGIKGKGPHEAKFIKRTEREMGETLFHGLELSRKGECYHGRKRWTAVLNLLEIQLLVDMAPRLA